jgi:hypothetical protein
MASKGLRKSFVSTVTEFEAEENAHMNKNPY